MAPKGRGSIRASRPAGAYNVPARPTHAGLVGIALGIAGRARSFAHARPGRSTLHCPACLSCLAALARGDHLTARKQLHQAADGELRSSSPATPSDAIVGASSERAGQRTMPSSILCEAYASVASGPSRSRGPRHSRCRHNCPELPRRSGVGHGEPQPHVVSASRLPPPLLPASKLRFMLFSCRCSP